ncbi:MAG: hypothetical protein E7470_06125 [Ruminococcaceae bacterium]|nr:hypothetical protein [Oscillospiraceae bacterium]
MYIGIDLGSTNTKAALYSENLTLLDQKGCPVEYFREDGFVEFDILAYYENLLEQLRALLQAHPEVTVRQIAFTGQAESLVCLDKNGDPVGNAISWMDERSTQECAILASQFSDTVCRRITGQQAVLPTWPATKILWLRRNRPADFERIDCFMLLKDYIVYRLTGKKCADMSIATFSFYFDIYRKCYWQEMLDAIGITTDQLPPLVEPCTVAGNLTGEAANATGLNADVLVNVGTLDHFAGMIGTGNTAPGTMTLSTGTAMVLATMAAEDTSPDCGIAMHYGFTPDTHVMLPVMESGGNCLEWFRRTCLNNIDYDMLNHEVENAPDAPELLFLPYLVGTNAPEFDSEACGVFFGLRQEHTAFHMAKAVMEGVSFVLRKNCDDIISKGTDIDCIIATGGGAKSAIWCQMQSDITGLPVVVPKVSEAACLGAAMIAAQNDGRYADLSAAAAGTVTIVRRYTPRASEKTEQTYRKFCKLYDAMLEIAKL